MNQSNHCLKEILLKIRYFERGLSKSLKKFIFIFFLLNPVPFNEQDYEKVKWPGTRDQLLFRFQNKLKIIPLSVMCYLTKFNVVIVCIRVSTPPLSCQAPLFRQSPLLYISFSWTPPLKVRFFSEGPKYQSFSSLTPSYLLKVTKFLVKISEFEFLVMTGIYFCLQTFFVIKYFRF